MISAHKLASLRLTLQPLTPFGAGATLSPCSNMSTMVSISSSTVPRTPRISPVLDIYMASPTPTHTQFALTTPTTARLPVAASTPISATMTECRSPILSVCVSEECSNPVLGARTACNACKASFHNILGQAAIPFPSQSAKRASKKTPDTVTDKPLPKQPKQPKPVLAAAHPRPTATTATKHSRKFPCDEPTSPDALYFGSGRRVKRPFRLALRSERRPNLTQLPDSVVAAQSATFCNAVEQATEAEKAKEESWLEKVDDA